MPGSGSTVVPEQPAIKVLQRPVRAIRATLGRPGTHGIVVLATLIALLGGWFGAGVASRIGLEFATPLPRGAEAEQLRQTVLPGVPATGDGDAPTWTFSDDGEHVVYGAAKYSAGPAGATLDVLDGAPDRLTAAGWRVQDVPAGESPLARASRDDLILDVTADGFTVTHATPGWLWRFALAGAAVGALIGWLITGWAGRRSPRGSISAQLAGLITWPTVVFMLLVLAGGFIGRPPQQTWRDVFYLHLLWTSGGSPRWLAVVAIAVLGIVAVLGHRPGRLDPHPSGKTRLQA